MLGFVLILYFESLHMKTQLQFLSDTFLSTVKDCGGFLSLSKNVVTMFFLCGTVFFQSGAASQHSRQTPQMCDSMDSIWEGMLAGLSIQSHRHPKQVVTWSQTRLWRACVQGQLNPVLRLCLKGSLSGAFLLVSWIPLGRRD